MSLQEEIVLLATEQVALHKKIAHLTALLEKNTEIMTMICEHLPVPANVKKHHRSPTFFPMENTPVD